MSQQVGEDRLRFYRIPAESTNAAPDGRLGLVDAIKGCLPDPRSPLYVVHEQRQMLAPRTFALAAGWQGRGF